MRVGALFMIAVGEEGLLYVGLLLVDVVVYTAAQGRASNATMLLRWSLYYGGCCCFASLIYRSRADCFVDASKVGLCGI